MLRAIIRLLNSKHDWVLFVGAGVVTIVASILFHS
jgi:hypothetical protein